MEMNFNLGIKILFLIGNGFDRNLGLNTSFNDILKEYRNIHKDTINPSIKKFLIELKQNYEEWSLFEKKLGEYTKKFNRKTKNVLIEQIDSFRKVMIDKLKYEESRINLSSNHDQLFTNLFSKSLINFHNYLPDEDRKIISPLFSSAFQVSRYVYNFISFNYTEILDNCLKILDKILRFEKPRFFIIGENNKQLIDDDIGEVLHIHGTLKKDFILGVDNKEQIKNRKFKNDVEMQYLIKSHNNIVIGENNINKAKELIDISRIIVVFGMSIGETDKTWWNYIHNWLKSDNTRELVIFYYNENLDITNPRTKGEHKKMVNDLFFTSAGIKNAKDISIVEKQIHIPFENNDMFKLNLLDKPNNPTYSNANSNRFDTLQRNLKTIQQVTKTPGLDKLADVTKKVNEAFRSLDFLRKI
jgi:hypothetical protein